MTDFAAGAPSRLPRRGERRRQQTRGAIMTAGQQLFATRSIEGVSIDEIVAAAEVAKGSFYNHFADKDGLARAIVERVQDDCERHVSAANDAVADPAMRMARALCIMIDYARTHPDRLLAMLSLTARGTRAGTPLNAGVTADVAGGLAAGRFADVTVEAGVLIAIGLTNVTVIHAMTSPTPPAALAGAMGAAILRALGMASAEAIALARVAADALLEG